MLLGDLVDLLILRNIFRPCKGFLDLVEDLLLVLGIKSAPQKLGDSESNFKFGTGGASEAGVKTFSGTRRTNLSFPEEGSMPRKPTMRPAATDHEHDYT